VNSYTGVTPPQVAPDCLVDTDFHFSRGQGSALDPQADALRSAVRSALVAASLRSRGSAIGYAPLTGSLRLLEDPSDSRRRESPGGGSGTTG